MNLLVYVGAGFGRISALQADSVSNVARAVHVCAIITMGAVLPSASFASDIDPTPKIPVLAQQTDAKSSTDAVLAIQLARLNRLEDRLADAQEGSGPLLGQILGYSSAVVGAGIGVAGGVVFDGCGGSGGLFDCSAAGELIIAGSVLTAVGLAVGIASSVVGHNRGRRIEKLEEDIRQLKEELERPQQRGQSRLPRMSSMKLGFRF